MVLSEKYEQVRCDVDVIRTGVSNAMHAIILGQSGASLSGRELAIARRVSAASKPPILRRYNTVNKWSFRSKKGTDLCPHRTTLAFPAPPPVPFATSLSTTKVVSQSANRSTASF